MILVEHFLKTMDNEIIVYLSPEDAKKFIQFQEYYHLFSLLLDRKVFEQRGAAITLHFDTKGTLRTIARNDFLYSASTPFDNMNEKVL